MKYYILTLIIILGISFSAKAETLKADSVVCDSLQHMLDLHRAVNVGNWIKMGEMIDKNQCRRCSNCPVQVQVTDTYEQFSRIEGIRIPGMSGSLFWTYTQYLSGSSYKKSSKKSSGWKPTYYEDHKKGNFGNKKYVPKENSHKEGM